MRPASTQAKSAGVDDRSRDTILILMCPLVVWRRCRLTLNRKVDGYVRWFQQLKSGLLVIGTMRAWDSVNKIQSSATIGLHIMLFKWKSAVDSNAEHWWFKMHHETFWSVYIWRSDLNCSVQALGNRRNCWAFTRTFRLTAIWVSSFFNALLKMAVCRRDDRFWLRT